MNGALTRLLRAELRLMTRDPLVLTFVLVFPIVTMLIIGGSFSADDADAFYGVDPPTGTWPPTSPWSSPRRGW